MKKYIISGYLLLFLLTGCTAKKNVSAEAVIRGTVADADVETVFLEDRVDREYVIIDSAAVTDGAFVMQTALGYAQRLFLKSDKAGPRFPYFLSPGEQSVHLDFDSPVNSRIEGSEAHVLFEDFNAGVAEIDRELKSVQKKMEKASMSRDQAAADSLEKVYISVKEKEPALVLSWASEHAASPVASYVMDRNAYFFDYDEILPFYQKLDEKQKQNRYALTLKKYLDVLKTVQVGEIVPDITLPDPGGNLFTLSDIRGQYTLLDFWASWCGPCRTANPDVVRLYKQFRKKGFRIVGISLDRDHDAWLEAMQQDGLTWVHVSDLKGWNSQAVEVYGVRSIPHTLLLDPEGRIVARNLNGKALRDKVAELYGEN